MKPLRDRARLLRILATLPVLMAALSPASARAQVITQSGRTRDFNGQGFVTRFLFVDQRRLYAGSDRVADPLDRKVQVWAVTLASVYGVRPNWTLKAALPYVVKTLSFDEVGGRRKLSAAGLGDAVVSSKYRFYRRAGVLRSFDLAVLAGLKIPTGSHRVDDEGMLLPRPLQPGSGSWDIQGGTALTWVRRRWRIDADVLYWWRTAADGFEFGDRLQADASLRFRLAPAHYPDSLEETIPKEFFLFAEVNSSFASHSRQGGRQLADSGGDQIFLAPGFWWILKPELLVEGAVQLPLYRDLNGTQLGVGVVGIVGVRYLF